MRGGDDRAHARLVAGDGRKPDALREHAVLRTADPTSVIASAPSPTMTGVIGLSLTPVLKPSACKPGLEEPRVVPQPFDELRLFQQHVERGEAGRGDRRRVRRREQERPRAVMQEVDERPLPAT